MKETASFDLNIGEAQEWASEDGELDRKWVALLAAGKIGRRTAHGLD